VRALELSDESKRALEELQALSEKAEAGDKEARRELRRAVRNYAPEVIARASDIARNGQEILARTAAAGIPLYHEALIARLDMLREEIAGENPTPLEVLLTERIVSCWMLTTLLEMLLAAQYGRGEDMDGKRSSPSSIIYQSRILESATRRYLAAIRELARVRKLQAGVPQPGVQVNTQINVRP
jgi:hypothetical protein